MRVPRILGASLLLLPVAGCGSTGTPGDDGADTGAADDGVDGDGSGGTTDAPSDGSGGPTASVTYHEHVRAILERHCVSCHTEGQIAPFALTSYDAVHDLRESILAAVDAGIMPPWLPEAGCTDYLGDLTMADADLATLHTWVDEGAVEGDPDDYVPPDVPAVGGLSRVDATLQMPEPYTPGPGPDDYRCFLLDWPEAETSYVSGFRAVPDNLTMVHHVIAFAISPDQVAEYEALDAAEPGAGYTCFGGPGGEITDAQSAGKWLGAWAPGGLSGDFPEGTGIEMEPGSKVVLQVHYNTLTADSAPDQTSVEFKIDPSVDKPALMLLWADPGWLTGGMTIPAGEASVTHTFEFDPTPFLDYFTDVIPPNAPFRIHGVTHHMHTLGTRGRQAIVHADGTETCLLSLPRWDFNWQNQYRLAEPVVFEPGDQLHLECEFDNAAGDADVNWGDGTSDEMCLGVYFVTAP